MAIDADTLKAILANTRLVAERLSAVRGAPVGKDAASVKWLEEFIETQRGSPDLDEEAIEGLIWALGGYLGEAIIEATGGAWVAEHDTLLVRFPNGAACSPFSKVAKQFDQGLEAGESVAGFYDMAVNQVAPGKLDAFSDDPGEDANEPPPK